MRIAQLTTRSLLIAVALLLTQAALFSVTVLAEESCTPFLSFSCAFIAHEDNIGAIAYSPDGKILATASSDRSIILWDVASGRITRTLKGHNGEVWALDFSPDGKLLASGSHDFTVKIWEIATGNVLHTLTGHKDFARTVAFSPDGQTLASGSWDHTIKLWSVTSGRLLRTLTGHADWVVSIDFSPDGKKLISGSDDFSVRVWDVATGGQLRKLTGHTKNVWAVRYSPTSEIFATGAEDRTIRIWDADTLSLLHTMTGHTKEIRSLAFSADGKQLASASKDGSVRIWDPLLGREIGVIHNNDEADVWGVAFSPQGTQLTSGACTRRSVHLCRVGEVRHDVIGNEPPVEALDLDSFDKNKNKFLEDSEFFSIVDAWLAEKIGNQVFFAAVDIWVSNGQIRAAVKAAHVGSANKNINPVILTYKSQNLIEFSSKLKDISAITLEIFGPDGRRLHTQMAQGGLLSWNLKSSDEKFLANGIYFYVITQRAFSGATQKSGIQKLILLR